METTRGNIFLKRNVRSEPKYVSDENQNTTFVRVSYTHNGFRQIKIFTKQHTNIISSQVEIGLVEHILLTEHFHVIYTSCLTRNT